jgi:hypothetical protein
MSCFNLQAVTAREIVATGSAAARRIVCNALQHVETAKPLHAEILSILIIIETGEDLALFSMQ